MAFLGAIIEALIKMGIVVVFAFGGVVLGKILRDKKNQEKYKNQEEYKNIQ